MNLKRNIIFYIERRRKNGVLITENVPIRMRVIFNGKRIEFTTGHRIDASKWDEKKQAVKNGCTNKLKISASDINSDLKRYEAEIQTVFKDFEVQDIMPTMEQIKSAFNSRVKLNQTDCTNDKRIDFWNVFDIFVKENGRLSSWSDSTFKKFKTTRNHIKDFKEDIYFEYFDKSGLNEYLNFLQSKGLINSTVVKQIKLLKWFMRWAYENGYHKNNAILSYRPKLMETEKKVIYLNDDELEQLESYKIPESKQYLERVRDVFMFCCFTGLRYSDVFNLKREDIKKDTIEITTVKTNDNLVIELNNISKQILDKYKDVPFKNSKALPVISNQKMNDYLKELCELAGINEPIRRIHFKGNNKIDTTCPKYSLIGTHTGRRTFVCRALSKGIPVNVVMKWTGHSDYKSMKPYIDIANKTKAEYMKFLDL